jgi:hypothetical protein
MLGPDENACYELGDDDNQEWTILQWFYHRSLDEDEEKKKAKGVKVLNMMEKYPNFDIHHRRSEDHMAVKQLYKTHAEATASNQNKWICEIGVHFLSTVLKAAIKIRDTNNEDAKWTIYCGEHVEHDEAIYLLLLNKNHYYGVGKLSF